MLKLHKIVKDYVLPTQTTHALKGVSLSFRESEFVAILGPSGCGKTTLLNIIGGLDRYTSGDLIIDQVSTKSYQDADWDSYRNHRVGFVFQNYNLITHATILGNVEMALTLSGVSKKERVARAKKALTDVGLEEHIYKKPNQLSGGQMQRVAIARALVNDPTIILADEPTGALDSKTSVQIMEILKSISKDRLIIMVTHNPMIAEKYSDRLIHLLDGEVVSDSNPYEPKRIELKDHKQPKTAMSFFTALKLSFDNLVTKKVRTIITALAGSIGIIGVGLVLSLYNGVNTYLDAIQKDSLAGFPITIEKDYIDVSSFLNQGKNNVFDPNYIYPYESQFRKTNKITQKYLTYIETLPSDLYMAIRYQYHVEHNFAINYNNTPVYWSSTKIGDSTIRLNDLIKPASFNPSFFDDNFDIIGGVKPKDGNLEAMLIVNSSQGVPEAILRILGFSEEVDGKLDKITIDSFLNQNKSTIRLMVNSEFYIEDGSHYRTLLNEELAPIYNKKITIDGKEVYKNPEIKIVGVAMPKEGSLISETNSIIFFDDVTNYVLEDAKTAPALVKQQSQYASVIAGISKEEALLQIAGLAANDEGELWRIPKSIHIYPNNFDDKTQIRTFLEAYNETILNEDDKIYYVDQADLVTSIVGQMVDMITYVLVAFAAISLFVSSIMIGIITYVSVIERTKEIGILRSLGARKKDIRRVFNAETLIIGFSAGLIGVIVTIILNPLISSLLYSQANIKNLAVLNIFHAIILIVISMSLTTIAGLVPASIASKKDPVVALRTE